MDNVNDPKLRVHARARNKRQRFLNIIYFLDSHRTRTLKFTVRSASITLGVLALLLGWSFVASGLLIREYQINGDLRHHARSLLSTIFTYQTRYDEVYENAYPDKQSGTSLLTHADKDETSEDTEEVSGNEITPIALSKSLPEGNVSGPPATPGSAAEPKERVVGQSLEEKLKRLEFPILIENFSAQTYNDTLVARFALKNIDRPNKSAGTLIATAKFIDSNQHTTLVDMEIEEDVSDSSNEGTESSSDQHYNIRYYKNKRLSFIKPKGKVGEFASVAISLQDEGGRKKEYSFPIPQAPTHKPAQAPPQETPKGPLAQSDPDL